MESQGQDHPPIVEMHAPGVTGPADGSSCRTLSTQDMSCQDRKYGV